jgi:hypothetical protein
MGCQGVPKTREDFRVFDQALAWNRLQTTVGCLGDALCGQFDPGRHQRACVAVCSGYLVEVGNRTMADLSDLGTLPFIGKFEKIS